MRSLTCRSQIRGHVRRSSRRRYCVTLFRILIVVALTLPFSNAQLMASHVVINEFEQNPPGNESLLGGEFVELFNPTGPVVDISGWILSTTHGKICSYTIPSGTMLHAGPSWFVVSLSGQCIDNSDQDSVVLQDRNGAEVDRTPSMTDAYNDGRDWQRIPDAGISWSFKSATKGYSNASTMSSGSPNAPACVELHRVPTRTAKRALFLTLDFE